MRCWSVGVVGMTRWGLASEATSASVSSVSSELSSHWLSPPAPPSHVPPAASLAAGGLTGVGGGASMMNNEEDKTEDRKRRQEANGSPVFLACWFLRLHVRIFLLPGAFLQPLYSCLSHFSQSPTHCHSQLGIPIKTKSLHIFRAGTRPLCKSGPLMTCE